MKILKDEEFAALKLKADNWTGIVSAVKESNADFNSEEATPETIAEALSSTAEKVTVDDTALQSANDKIAALNSSVAEKEEKIKELNTQVQNLKDNPAEKTASAGASEKELVASEEAELVSFASDNKEDLNSIAEKAIEEGFFPKKK